MRNVRVSLPPELHRKVMRALGDRGGATRTKFFEDVLLALPTTTDGLRKVLADYGYVIAQGSGISHSINFTMTEAGKAHLEEVRDQLIHLNQPNSVCSQGMRLRLAFAQAVLDAKPKS